jgi:signal transduction histidine kinase
MAFPRHSFGRTILGAIALLGFQRPATAQNTKPNIHGPFRLGEVRIDGVLQDSKGAPYTALRFASNARFVDLALHPSSAAFAHTRFRYRLEGYDSSWRDAGAWMRITARFSDQEGNVISGEELDVRGESPGWTGAPLTSPMSKRQFSMEVPENAQRLMIWTCTSGPLSTVGVHAMADLTAVLQPGLPSQLPSRLPLISDHGSLMGAPEGTPMGWARHGTFLGSAQILPREGGSPLLILKDESSETFGGWLTTGKVAIPIQNARAVALEWNEAYSIGWAGPSHVAYSFLPAGNYRLLIQALSPEGFPTGEETSIPVHVVPPFHQTLWFRLLLIGTGSLGLILIVRNATRRRMNVQIEVMNREKAVIEERLRIARDLHDSLGADLTHLALLSDLAHRNSQRHGSEDASYDQVFETARNLTRRVDEIVWTLNPIHDSLPHFVEFLGNAAQKFLNSACIRCRLDFPASVPQITFGASIRHDLFLAAKEALHNVVKHSHASEVWLRIRVESETLRLAIQDNGCGFAADSVPGNGSETLRARISRLSGRFEVSTSPGGGTTVEFVIPLHTLK